jgi:hypothetical protein
VAATSSVSRCYPQDLSASLHGAEIGSNNHVGFILTLTNNGQRPSFRGPFRGFR